MNNNSTHKENRIAMSKILIFLKNLPLLFAVSNTAGQIALMQYACLPLADARSKKDFHFTNNS